MALRSKNKKNGQDPDDKQDRAVDSKAQLAGLQAAPQEETPENQAQLLEELTCHDIDAPNGDKALANLLTKDIPSANFSGEEAQEFRAYVDVALMKKRARHPHEGQIVTGVLREWVHDDPDAGLEHIDRGDLLADETFGQVVKSRVSKGRDGTLLRTVLSSIRQSIVRREDGGNDGGGRILSRLKN